MKKENNTIETCINGGKKNLPQEMELLPLVLVLMIQKTNHQREEKDLMFEI